MKQLSAQKKEINIKCFGKLAIYVNGIEQSIKMNSLKGRELIAFLLTYKGEAVSKTTICNALWESKSEECGRDNLYKLIKKVKKMPIPFILNDTKGLLQLRIDNIECDMVTFEKLLEEEDVRKKEKAVDLYRGMLFEEENYNWVYMKDAHYDNKYIDTLDYLQEHYTEKNNSRKAMYYKGLMDDYL